MQSELLNCPFCWTTLPPKVERRTRVGSYVVCVACCGQGPANGTAAEAIAAWNTRATPPEQPTEQAKIITYDEMHETAVSLSYPSILEALEHLSELIAPSATNDGRYGRIHTDGSRSGGQPPAMDQGLAAAINRTIERCRKLPDHAGRPAWDEVLKEELAAAIHQAQIAAAKAMQEACAKPIQELADDMAHGPKPGFEDRRQFIQGRETGNRDALYIIGSLDPATIVKEAGHGN